MQFEENGFNDKVNDAGKATYYYLKEGDVIQEGDEFDNCNDGWRDWPKWIKTSCAGQKAPNPNYPSHRKYRRLISA